MPAVALPLLSYRAMQDSFAWLGWAGATALLMGGVGASERAVRARGRGVGSGVVVRELSVRRQVWRVGKEKGEGFDLSIARCVHIH